MSWRRLTNQRTASDSLAVFTIVGTAFTRICARRFFCGDQPTRSKKTKTSSGTSSKRFEEMLGTFENFRNMKLKTPVQDDYIRDVQKEFSVSPDQKNFTVSVEGNIGCGKTTLLEYFQQSDSVQALQEPVEQWTNIQGHNALGLLYEDPSRWSFSFNMYAQLTRIKMHTKPHTKPIKMLERSLYSTRYCFVENSYRSQTINGLEYAILTEWFNWLSKTQKAELDLIVYLHADPEVCYERIKKRSRKEESCVPKTLIDDIHDLHEDWLVKQTLGSIPAPVLILDANRGYDKMKSLYEDKRQEILCGHV
ncbi:thymidine kinase 2, mitochondrial-like isoform X2 [Haliotis rubra]|uniref:thymidine kinase 2, mitochondrial-like isoform X2 n=1 Tax=Haliotis rubra TaxID=36100 RepID=UPI001EE5F677|nr:thymidine kinase 2, mitochondrial-like isoform X2 [Haliotis rubra]